MATETLSPLNLAGDIARIGALLAAIQELACKLEDPVAACAGGFNLVTAIQACAESAIRHVEDADAAIQATTRGSAL